MNARSVARAVGLLLVAAACVVVGGCGGNGKSVQPLLPALVIDESGHGLVVRDTVGSVTPDRALSWSYHELHAPAVHHDGERFAIVGRPTKHDPLRLYVGTLDDKPPRSLGADVDARTRLAWLPDDRIVYSAIAHDTSRALFVTASQDRPGGQITFGGTHANDPFVLKDGRVLFCGTRVETDGTRKPALFTVRPDGTG
ncbi:MAG: hypothetical protein QNJ90_14415, partial [Planctomycetota bacterium]|nr:hypothetical protein [Planctomycetota bacterium]